MLNNAIIQSPLLGVVWVEPPVRVTYLVPNTTALNPRHDSADNPL